MQRRQFEDLSDELYEMVIDTLLKKGVEYQKDGNVFSNFEENAKDLGLTKYQIWNIYFNKHIKSISNAIKSNPEDPTAKEMPEKLQGRIVDAIAYLLLLNGMINEKEESKTPPKKI
jgi:hypothetical protein